MVVISIDTLRADRLPAYGYRAGRTPALDAPAGFVSSYALRAETGIAQGLDVYNAEFPAAASDRSPGQVQRPGLQTLAAAEGWMNGLASDRALLFFHIPTLTMARSPSPMTSSDAIGIWPLRRPPWPPGTSRACRR